MYYVYMDEEKLSIETINFVPSIPKKEKDSKRFKYTEIMLVLSALGVLIFLALLAINPSKEAAEARNLQRSADVAMILSYVSSYVNAQSEIPEAIPSSTECVEYGNEICKTGPFDCTDLVSMSFLIEEDEEALLVIPTDPQYISINGTGYFISQDDNGTVTVCAPHAERNEKISFSKYMY